MKIQLKSLLNKTGAIFDSVSDLSSFMSNFKYIDFTTLMSPKEVLMTKQGSCHDQVMFEFKMLNDMGLNPHAKFIMGIYDDSRGGETHSFIYYQNNNLWYWFENAWQDYKGIRSFNSYEDMIDFIIHIFDERHRYTKLYIADFDISEHSIGEDLNTFVDTCMNSSEEYNFSNNGRY